MLLVDIGNTRVKWATLHDGTFTGGIPVPHRGQSFPVVWQSMWGNLPPPGRMMVANVAGSAAADSLSTWAMDRWGLQPDFVRATAAACGVRSGYSQPAQLGVDRWAALIGARQQEAYAGQHLCVVGSGTALTVDVLTAGGEHLGGWIAPGIDMMSQLLAQGTAALTGELVRGDPGQGFGRSTQEAVASGIRHAAAGMIERAVLTARTMLDQPPVCIVSGGAADDLLRFLPADAVAVPDLVLHGLAAIALQRG